MMKIDFNEWLYERYGITSDDLTGEDYDMYEAEYEEALERKYGNCSLAKKGKRHEKIISLDI